MAPSKEVVRILKAYVETDEGVVAVPKGEPLPANVVEGEAERMRELGALTAGEPASSDEGDEVTALAASLTEAQVIDYVRDTTIKEIVAAVGEDAELARKVLTAEEDATNGEPRKSLVTALTEIIGEPASSDEGDEVTALAASLTEAQVIDYVRDTTIKEIVAAVGEDAELARKVLTAEEDATNGEPRKSLVTALTEIIGEPASSDEGDEVTALAASLTEAQVIDYVRDTTIKEIVAAVGEDAELARKVLTAEEDATNGEPRKSLVTALTEIIGEPASSDEG